MRDAFCDVWCDNIGEATGASGTGATLGATYNSSYHLQLPPLQLPPQLYLQLTPQVMDIIFLSEVVIPDCVVEPFGKRVSEIYGHFSDDDLKRHLDVIWFLVTKALFKFQGLEDVVVTKEVYEENIRRRGERDLLLLLRNALTSEASEDWRSVLTNGIFPIL